MSLRPRPVTATVTKPKWMEPYVVRPPSVSMDSTGSTASLTSVLEHDSYISPAPSDDDWEDEKYIEKSEDDEIYGRNQHDVKENLIENFHDKVTIRSKLADYEDSTLTESSPADEKLSPWEKWLIAKTKVERQKRKQCVKEKKEAKLQKQLNIQAKKDLREKAEEKRKEWLEQKNIQEKERRKSEKHRIKLEREIKAEEQRRIADKAEIKYKEWKISKNKDIKDKLKMEKRKKEEEEAAKLERKKIAEEKYEKWCQKAQARPKSVPNSFGYTSGKLTGYHDTNAYPAPSFYNPIPWHHVPVPKVKSDKSKLKARVKTKSYTWNPQKYF